MASFSFVELADTYYSKLAVEHLESGKVKPDPLAEIFRKIETGYWSKTGQNSNSSTPGEVRRRLKYAEELLNPSEVGDTEENKAPKSKMNSYLYNSPQRTSGNGQDPLNLLQGSGSNSNLQLDLSQFVSSVNSGPAGLNVSSMLQSLQQQQGRNVGSTISQQQQQQQQQRQSIIKTKKIKEPVLKTPLSLLNEICAKAKLTPVFTVEEDGPVHCRVYNCTVKVETVGYTNEATASGKTKKDAKQDAAKAILLQMDEGMHQYLIPKAEKEESPAPVVEVDPDVPGNPVGDLNDLCTKLKRMPPEYADISEVGKPHERVYTVACKLGNHIQETGRGRSKKTAKKAAAYKVHKRVQELLAQGSKEAGVLQDDDNLIEKLSNLTLVSKQEAKKICEGWKLSDWVADLRSRTGPKIEQFKEPSLPRLADPMKLLREISDEQRLKLEFMELQDPRNADMKTCLIAVSAGSQPITVLMGSADSKTQAKKIAAENFIEMLRSVLLSR